MPFDGAYRRFLLDIRYHLDLVDHFIGDMNYAAFSADIRTTYAVVRCLEIMSEASRRLPDNLKGRHPEIDWKAMAGAGNVYRHDYEDVAAQYVWATVQRDLPPLKDAIETELAL